MGLALPGCTKSGLVDFTMSSARHQPEWRRHVDPSIGPYQLLAGDLHCHILPPDAPYHVARELPETLDLARREGLDFVVLTPHVNARFFLDADRRDWVLRTQRELRARLASLPATDLVVIPGMEYTDHLHGHVGLSFADVERVLERAPLDVVNEHPERFFEAWRAEGGLAIIHHPFLSALPKAPIAELHYDMSWRAFREPVHPGMTEIHWLTRHADAIETWNESVGHVRDRWFLGDPDWEMRQASHLVDRLAREQARVVAPVGGSDSHGSWLRPTTWVLAKERSAAGVREAIASARTCVRAPEPCTLEARGDGAWVHVGGAIASVNGAVEARARGRGTYFLNGEAVATSDGATVRIATSGRCSTLRVEIHDGSSASIYVDCGFAGPPAGSTIAIPPLSPPSG